jgi:hypothetical protein
VKTGRRCIVAIVMLSDLCAQAATYSFTGDSIASLGPQPQALARLFIRPAVLRRGMEAFTAGAAQAASIIWQDLGRACP